MKSNLIPALVLAAAILVAAFSLRHIPTVDPAASLDAVLAKLEDAAQKKDGGESRLGRIFQGMSRSISSGFAASTREFEARELERTKGELATRDLVHVLEAKIASSQSRNAERIIGLVKNDSDKVVTNIRLNVIYRDREGHLLDVGSSVNVQGHLRPGQTIGFDGMRSLGDYNEAPELLASRKSESISVAVVGLTVLSLQ